MNKKIISSILATLMIVGSTSLTAFAAMNKGTVVIGQNAFDFEYANDPSNFDEITNAIVSGGEVYVKGFDGKWIDNNTGLAVSSIIIPAVVYKSATEKTNFDAQDKDVEVEQPLKVMSVSDINISKNVGDTYTLPETMTVTLADQSTKDLAVTWDQIADTKVAGSFTFIGTLTMVNGVVNSDNVTVRARLNVLDNTIKVTSVSLNKATDILTVGDTDNLTTTIDPNNATNNTVTWTTSNSKVATVTNGVVTALELGTTVITATTVDGSKTANCTVTVNKKSGYVYNTLLDNDLKVRATPELSGTQLGVLYNYEKVEILDSMFDTSGNKWDEITYNTGVAYVYDPYIQHYTSPADNVVDIAKSITKQFEVGTSDQIAGNSDGQGLSLGYLQWCIGQETLQPLLNRMYREYPKEMESIFGTNNSILHSTILSTKEEQSIWAEGINNTFNNIMEPWKTQFVELSNNPEFIKIEEDAEVYTVKQAMIICNTYKLNSIRGFALAFDIETQNGGISTEAAKIIDATCVETPNMKEKDLLEVIANAVADSSGSSSEDVRLRKMTIVNGKGTVHYFTLNLDANFGLSDTNWR